MSRSGRRYGVFLGLAATFVVAPGQRVARACVVEELLEPNSRSYMEVQSVPVGERVFGQGAVLVLAAHGIPATPHRSPTPPAWLMRVKGPRLVVLHLKMNADRVRPFRHTLEPIGTASGTPAYGCTECVVRFDPSALDRGDVRVIEQRIDPWVPLLERRG